MQRSSRRRFRDYRRTLKRRGARGLPEADLPADLPVARVRSATRHRSFWRLFREFWGLLRGHRRVIVANIALAGLGVLLGLAPLASPKIVIDYVLGEQPLPPAVRGSGWIPTEPRELLIALAIAALSVAVVALAVSTFARWQLIRKTRRVQSDFRRRVFQHAARLPIHRVHEIKSGGVANILRDDAGDAGELIFAMLYQPSRAVFQLVGSLAVLAWVDWRLLIGSLALLPIVWLTHRTWIDRIRPIYRHIRAARQQINAHATEVFGGMRVVRGFNRQQSEAGRFTGNNHFVVRQELMAWWWSRGIDIAWSILIPAASAAILVYGGLRILDDRAAIAAGTLAPGAAFTEGDLVLFLTYLAWLLNPIATLAAGATQFQNSLAGLDRTLDVLDEPREFSSNPGAVVLDRERVAGRIEMVGVGFTYPRAEQPVLRGIDLDVEPGHTVAFVGPSGAGKTTLCNLIARFFDVTEGRILLDGTDLREIDVGSYRSLLGIVEQDVFLFDGTIAENIAYGGRNTSQEQIIRAARTANADGFITELPDGYETLIGERGVRLSGGQRQRLAIARAALADPKVLILDEATSSLDTESERLIQAGLDRLMAGRTGFVIAHRLSTIRHADLIVVLENGRIAERGRHEELMARSGRYRAMVELQTRPEDATIAERDMDEAFQS